MWLLLWLHLHAYCCLCVSVCVLTWLCVLPVMYVAFGAVGVAGGRGVAGGWRAAVAGTGTLWNTCMFSFASNTGPHHYPSGPRRPAQGGGASLAAGPKSPVHLPTYSGDH